MRLSICFVALSENRVPPNSKPHGLSSCMRRVIQPMGVSAYPRLSPMFSVQMCIYTHIHIYIYMYVHPHTCIYHTYLMCPDSNGAQSGITKGFCTSFTAARHCAARTAPPKSSVKRCQKRGCTAR